VIEELYLEGVQILIIVSDWLMPGIRGDEFQSASPLSDIVTVLLTGHADEAAIEQRDNTRTSPTLPNLGMSKT